MATVNFKNPFSVLEQDSNHNYYLTGSRYFEHSSEFSDWDFFTQDSEETFEYLVTNGFSLRNSSNYLKDKEICRVLRYSKPGIQIDVQLVSDVNLKLEAQTLIEVMGIYNPYEDMNAIWNKAVAYIKAQKLLSLNS